MEQMHWIFPEEKSLKQTIVMNEELFCADDKEEQEIYLTSSFMGMNKFICIFVEWAIVIYKSSILFFINMNNNQLLDTLEIFNKI